MDAESTVLCLVCWTIWKIYWFYNELIFVGHEADSRVYTAWCEKKKKNIQWREKNGQTGSNWQDGEPWITTLYSHKKKQVKSVRWTSYDCKRAGCRPWGLSNSDSWRLEKDKLMFLHSRMCRCTHLSSKVISVCVYVCCTVHIATIFLNSSF